MHYAPETRSGIFAVQRHGKPLAEHDSAGAFSLELAYGQGRSLGKLRPNSPRLIIPRFVLFFLSAVSLFLVSSCSFSVLSLSFSFYIIFPQFRLDLSRFVSFLWCS